MSPRHLVWIILLSLLMKGLYIGFAAFVETVDDSFSFKKEVRGVQKLFKRHDTYWYQKIHQEGYPKVSTRRELGWHDKGAFLQSSWGFMPGYPMLTKIVSLVIGRGFLNSAFILSLLLSTTCFLLFYRLAFSWFEQSADAFFSTLLFMVLPFQYYFSMMYTEGLYTSLLIGTFIAAEKRAYAVVGLLTAYIVLVRPIGVVMLLPISLYVAESIGIFNGFRIQRTTITLAHLAKFSFLILPILSFAAYCYYQYQMTGYFNAYSIAQQEGWYRAFMFPLAGLFRQGGFVHQFTSWYAIVFMLLALLLWKKLPLSYNLVIWVGLLLPLTAGTSIGMTRYVTVLFPLFWFFADWLRPFKWKWVVLPLAFGIQLYTFYFWLINHPFSQ